MPGADDHIERALAIGAHPDDIDFGAGGTVASWVRAGIEVTYLVVTRGEEGGFDDTPREAMPALREAEQRAGAAQLAVTDVRFLDGYRDGDVQVSHALVRDLTRVIRQVRPQRALVMSPERNYDRLPASHPDHLAVGEASLRAVYPAARNAFAYPQLVESEGLEPWTVPDLWIMAHPAPDHAVDITDVIGLKLAALRAHTSQTSHLGPDGLAERVRGWTAMTAARMGLPEGRLAEAFRRVDAR